MNASDPAFRVRSVEARVEILPHADAWQAHHNTAWGLLAIWAVVPAYLAPNLLGLLFVGLLALAALSIRFVNARLRRQNDIPLVIGNDRSISYGTEKLFAGGEVRGVRIVQQQNYDEADSFGVLVVRRQGAPIAMPYPYFDHLSPTEGAALAVELAKALGTVVVRGPVTYGGATRLARLLKAEKVA
jgi:hypothetical protein